jgi:hypothetical protein
LEVSTLIFAVPIITYLKCFSGAMLSIARDPTGEIAVGDDDIQ